MSQTTETVITVAQRDNVGSRGAAQLRREGRVRR